ncbi:response regulator [Rhizobium leguminosarum]|jgi:DNA-binding NtrC family response regulator|uniref:Response regulator receiver protein n=1 Tax=Rhizobium leguminosarum bv. trifolii (strain WSM1325) TaxID=395491 RepID=C6B968_RHILS|nr:response regulator [Rhizobium leguminosarum]ACS60456.1 response regulator receiver protein [Rhizobium leguminosarum bv. trifolii WSM1325]MBY2912274.1 response regulator [Rhizobium leguminosarum]MBY2952183.1 response regulator [Rhizobium leguminosarum]MBY2967930.1 response regulator [Rhizobium leguminosarum]MBY2988629.1 response regulator [Rhizobium leguminosarum]
MAVILVVEDEPLIRFLLSDELVDAGHTVIEAASALEAIAVLGRCDHLDVMITDVDMPGGLSGIDLMKLVRSTRPETSVWVASGRDVRSQIDPGVFFLPKPYDYRELVYIVSERAHVRQVLATDQQRSG